MVFLWFSYGFPTVYTAMNTFQKRLTRGRCQVICLFHHHRAAEVIVIHDQTLHQLVIHQVLTDLCTSTVIAMAFFVKYSNWLFLWDKQTFYFDGVLLVLITGISGLNCNVDFSGDAVECMMIMFFLIFLEIPNG